MLARGRFGTDAAGYRLLVKQVREQWPHHQWAVEGAQGVGRPLAQRLLAQGETVLDVPAKLAARVRVFDTGNARKTDATDAHAIAQVVRRDRPERVEQATRQRHLLGERITVVGQELRQDVDATDAHAVAMVALRTPRLRELAYDEVLIALRLLTDRRDELSHRRVQTVNRLQRLLAELIPGGAKRDLSALQARRLLATVRPSTLAAA